VQASPTGTVKSTKTPKSTSTPKTGSTAKASQTPTPVTNNYVEIATFAVDASDAGSKSITIPAKSAPGDHEIAVYGKTAHTIGTVKVTVVGGSPTAAATATGGSSAPAANGTDASNSDPTNASAKCKDGTYSHSKTASGTCANHGGVDSWINKPAG
jgi:Protein of unknown function (DUF3761)